MADSTKNDDVFASGGGGAVDDLTPPTMKYADGGVPTQNIPPPSSADSTPDANKKSGELDATMVGPASPQSPKARPGRTSEALKVPARSGFTASGTVAGHGVGTIVGDLIQQDLSSEKLLRDAPRLESSGKICPSLNGIPLLAKLGQGGMGAVYYGIHPRLRSEVAVKVLPFHLAAQDPGMVQRFFREAQIAAKVRSPHLVSVIDVNEESGLFFLVMEYVAGITMGQYIKQLAERGTIGMDELDAIDVCLAASTGLDAAHQHGIVHRDLKPENIMVPYKSRQNKTFDLKGSKLMDLGLARSEEGNQSLTGVQAAMGTPGYMAPEQALDAKTADKRSDVFGMGATLYALLTGRPPFRGEAVMKVIMATMHEPHEPITNHRPDLSPALVDVIERCLDKRPENRFSDAHQLIRALRNCRKLLAPDSVFAEDERDVEGSELAQTAPRLRGTATPGVNPQLRLSGTGQRNAVNVPKKKWPLYAGLGAAVVVIAAVVAFALKGGGTVGPDDQKNKQVIRPLSDSEKKFAIEDHNAAIQAVRGYLSANDIDRAENKLNRALKADMDFPQLPALAKEWDAVRQEIKTRKLKNEFDKGQSDLAVLLANGQLGEANQLYDTLQPADAGQAKTKEKLKQQINESEQLLKNKEECNRLLAEAAKPGGLLKDKLALVERALEKVKDDKVALDRRDELKRQIKREADRDQVKTLLDGATDDFNRKLYDSAADKIAQIKEIDSGNEQMLSLDQQLTPLLTASKLAQKKNNDTRAALKAYTEATQFYADNDAVQAMQRIKTAIGFDSKNAAYDLLKTQIEVLRDDLASIHEVEQKRSQAMETLDGAAKLIDIVDDPLKAKALDDAATKIAGAAQFKLDDAAGKLSIDNKNLVKKLDDLKQQIAAVKMRAEDLKQQIVAKRAMLAEMQRYDTLTNEASTILVDNNKDGTVEAISTGLAKITDALKFVEAGTSVKDGSRAKDLETKLKAKLQEFKARDDKRKEVGALITTGDGALAEGRFADALKTYKDAEEKAKGLPTTDTDAVAQKISDASKVSSSIGKIDS